MRGPERNEGSGRARRLAWFVAIYAASLAASAGFVYGLRLVVPH